MSVIRETEKFCFRIHVKQSDWAVFFGTENLLESWTRRLYVHRGEVFEVWARL